MGTIIVIKGGAKTGKTTAIRAIYETLDAIVNKNEGKEGYGKFIPIPID
jgi:signal recognition particle receptor subunit beta